LVTGKDTPAPAGIYNPVQTATVSGNTTVNVALQGGYVASGRATDTSGVPVQGSVALQDTTSQTIFGPSLIDAAGFYYLAVPTGTYQAIVITNGLSTTDANERIQSGIATPVGSPFRVYFNTTGHNFTRADLPAVATLTVSFNVDTSVRWTPEQVVFPQADAARLGSVLHEIATDPVPSSVPVSLPTGTTRSVQADGQIVVGYGSTEDFTLHYAQTIPVTGSAPLALSIPALSEIYGTITPPAGTPPITYTIDQQGTGDLASASGDLDSSGQYTLGVPAGSYILTVGLTAPSHSQIDFLVPVTVAVGGGPQNFTLPALPSTRTVSGLVTKPDGTPLADASVYALGRVTTVPSGGMYRFQVSAITGTDGRYTLQAPDGSYDVFAVPSPTS
jgi:hypothetical protein